MSVQTRRGFLKAGAGSVVCGAAMLSGRRMLGAPLGLPIGLQLYSVRELLPKDYEGTLRQVAAIGYREVEAAGFFGHSAKEVKQAMAGAGLRCVSGHYPWSVLDKGLNQMIEFHKELGAEYIVCASPGLKDPASQSGAHGHPKLTMDDWKWNAEQFNRAGATVKAAGLKFGYHNHVAEFGALDGTVPYDELLRLTDAALVTFEMDCGWVTVGGGDPVAYLRKYPERISMLHVKDFKRGEGASAAPVAAELGQGTTDVKGIFGAAQKGRIKHYFVEQEGFDMPPFEALKIDADYMRDLSV